MAPHNAKYLAADLIFNHWPPRHEAETEPVIDHGETPAGELDRADQRAAYGLSVLDRPEAEAAFSGKLLAHPLDLLTSEGGQEILSAPHTPVGMAPGEALPDQFVLAAFQGIFDFGTKAGVGKRALFAVDQLPVEPGGAIAGDLAVKIIGREHAHIRFAAMGGIVGLGSVLEIVRNPPAVGIDPLDNAGAA